MNIEKFLDDMTGSKVIKSKPKIFTKLYTPTQENIIYESTTTTDNIEYDGNRALNGRIGGLMLCKEIHVRNLGNNGIIY